MTSPPEDNAGPLFSKPDLPEKPGPPNPSPSQEEQDLRPLAVESDKICPPPTSLRSRILEGVLIVTLAGAMIFALRGDEFLAAVNKQPTSRLTEAGWEAEWIIEQAQHFQRAEGRNPGSIAELSRRFPHAEIQPADPWGQDWVVSPTFQDIRTPPNPGDLWVCSRGPAGTGRCPPEDLEVASSSTPESIGYSARFGVWARAEEATWLQRLSDAWPGIGIVLFLGPLPGYFAYRMIRRGFDRPAPTLRGELGMLMGMLMIVVVGFMSAALPPAMPDISSLAPHAKAKADVRRLAWAVTTYAGYTGKLPATLRDLTAAAVNEQGLTAGPFMATVPTPPAGWSRYRYNIQADGTFTITSRGDGEEIRAPCPPLPGVWECLRSLRPRATGH
ncbi:MAG: hypothetical protein ACE5NC_09900 [Anaerolineae bacterium]